VVRPLRSLSRFPKENNEIPASLIFVKRYRPVHVSIVGGEPLSRVRELNVLLPLLSEMGIGVQLVTKCLFVNPTRMGARFEAVIVVSIDGLQP